MRLGVHIWTPSPRGTEHRLLTDSNACLGFADMSAERPGGRGGSRGRAMLRRADNVQIHFKPGMVSGKGWVTFYIGKRSFVRLGKQHKREVAATAQQQLSYPVRIVRVDQKTYWQFQNRFYWDNDDLDAAAVYALLVTRQQRQSQRIDRAQQIVAMGTSSRPMNPRGHIPDDVKHLVWTRDQGRCRSCGGATELQFDHVIPVAMGGGSGPENLQVLCGPCNRRKGASVTVR